MSAMVIREGKCPGGGKCPVTYALCPAFPPVSVGDRSISQLFSFTSFPSRRTKYYISAE